MTYKKLLLTALFQFIGILPLLMLRVMGAGIGRLLWWTNGREAKVTRRNLELCFPELSRQQRERLVRSSLSHSGQLGLEVIKVWMQPNKRTAARIRSVTNADLYESASSSGKGVLLLAPHLGNWEVLALWCAAQREVLGLYQPPKQALLEPIIKRARERIGNQLHPTDISGVRAILKALKGNGMTAILPDQEPEPEGGCFAPFYGVEALTMTLIHGLVSRTGCEVLMAYGQRIPGGWNIVFEEADADISSADLTQSVSALNRSVERCINACPEQYQWEYKRFKKRPDGLPKVYDFSSSATSERHFPR